MLNISMSETYWRIFLTDLDFVLSYAKRGELLHYINKLGCFDERCTKFYAAEIVLALQYLHGLGIIHRYNICTWPK